MVPDVLDRFTKDKGEQKEMQEKVNEVVAGQSAAE